MTGTLTKYKRRRGGLSWGFYFKANGKNHTKQGFASKDEAKAALDRAIADELGLPSPARLQGSVGTTQQDVAKGDTRQLKEYLSYWLESHAKLRCAPTTFELYRKLAAYLVRHLGAVRLCDLRAAAIQEMVNKLQIDGGAKGQPLSARRTHAIASLLYTCLADATRLEHLPSNVMAQRRVKLPRRPRLRPAVLDPGMLAKLFTVARGTRAYPFVVLAACSGARRGELCGLKWSDLDFAKRTLRIERSLEQTSGGHLRLKSTKSGEPRFFGLDDFALEVLSAHREQQEQDKKNFGAQYRNLDLIFCQPNGYYWSPNNIGLRVKELLVKAGFPNFSLHDLRHSHASVLLGQGVPLPVVSSRLGHRDSNVTLAVYVHALPSDVRAASNAWQNALSEAIEDERSSQKVVQKKLESLGKSRNLAVNL